MRGLRADDNELRKAIAFRIVNAVRQQWKRRRIQRLAKRKGVILLTHPGTVAYQSITRMSTRYVDSLPAPYAVRDNFENEAGSAPCFTFVVR